LKLADSEDRQWKVIEIVRKAFSKEFGLKVNLVLMPSNLFVVDLYMISEYDVVMDSLDEYEVEMKKLMRLNEKVGPLLDFQIEEAV